MDPYDPYTHRALVRDILVSWAIAVALLGVMLVLPHGDRPDLAGSAQIGADAAISKATGLDPDTPLR